MTHDGGSSAAALPVFHRAFLEHLGVGDGIFLAVLVISFLFGMAKGFSRAVGSVLVWGGALWITMRFNPFFVGVIAHTIAPTLQTTPLFVWSGRGVLFITTVVVLNVAAQHVVRLTQNLLSGGVDHIFGAAFGIVRGYVLLVIFFIVCGWAAPDWLGSLTQKSVMAPYVVRGVAFVEGYLPASRIEHLAFEPTNSH